MPYGQFAVWYRHLIKKTNAVASDNGSMSTEYRGSERKSVLASVSEEDPLLSSRIVGVLHQHLSVQKVHHTNMEKHRIPVGGLELHGTRCWCIQNTKSAEIFRRLFCVLRMWWTISCIRRLKRSCSLKHVVGLEGPEQYGQSIWVLCDERSGQEVLKSEICDRLFRCSNISYCESSNGIARVWTDSSVQYRQLMLACFVVVENGDIFETGGEPGIWYL